MNSARRPSVEQAIVAPVLYTYVVIIMLLENFRLNCHRRFLNTQKATGIIAIIALHNKDFRAASLYFQDYCNAKPPLQLSTGQF
jgi:hypothetical protein